MIILFRITVKAIKISNFQIKEIRIASELVF